MNDTYPCYRTSNPWTEQLFFYFPANEKGLAEAIEFCEKHKRYCVTFHKSEYAKPEIVWERKTNSFKEEMSKCQEKCFINVSHNDKLRK